VERAVRRGALRRQQPRVRGQRLAHRPAARLPAGRRPLTATRGPRWHSRLLRSWFAGPSELLHDCLATMQQQQCLPALYPLSCHAGALPGLRQDDVRAVGGGHPQHGAPGAGPHGGARPAGDPAAVRGPGEEHCCATELRIPVDHARGNSTAARGPGEDAAPKPQSRAPKVYIMQVGVTMLSAHCQLQ
jgi:hypothetical protein